jgi:hypothetical protein
MKQYFDSLNNIWIWNPATYNCDFDDKRTDGKQNNEEYIVIFCQAND